MREFSLTVKRVTVERVLVKSTITETVSGETSDKDTRVTRDIVTPTTIAVIEAVPKNENASSGFLMYLPPSAAGEYEPGQILTVSVV